MNHIGYKFPLDLMRRVDVKANPFVVYTKKDVDPYSASSIYWPYPLLFTFEEGFYDLEMVFVKDGKDSLAKFFNQNIPSDVKGVLVVPSAMIDIVPNHWKKKVKAFYFSDTREEPNEEYLIKDFYLDVKEAKILNKYTLVDKVDYAKVGVSSILLLAIMKLGYFHNYKKSTSVLLEYPLTPFHTLIITHLE